MKKTLNLLITTVLIAAISPSIEAQSDYTVTSQPVGPELTYTLIEHNNGKYAEHYVDRNVDDVSVGFFDQLPKDNSSGSALSDHLVHNIPLPSEQLSSLPIQFFEANSKIYCIGTKEVIVLDKLTGGILTTIPLSNAGNLDARGMISNVPVNKLITGNPLNNIVYCADLSNNLYFINTQTDQVVSTQTVDFVDQLSTSLVYNNDNDILYWLVNSWEGTSGTVLKAFDGTSGSLLTERFFNVQVNDMLYLSGSLFITDDANITKIDPFTLASLNNFGGGSYTKLFKINPIEFAVVFDPVGAPPKMLSIYDVSNFVLQQSFNTPYEAHSFISIEGHSSNQSFVFLTLATDGFSDIYQYAKDAYGDYQVVNHTRPLNMVFLSDLEVSSNESYMYFGGKDYLGRIDLNSFLIDYSVQVEGCYSLDIELANNGTSDVVYSANTIEGTLSRHDARCSLLDITQTGFKTNLGCYNPQLNRTYFLNNRIDYNNSGVAVISSSSNVLANIEVGKYLTDIVYNEATQKVFVSGKKENSVFVIDASTNTLIQTVVLPEAPTKLYSYQNQIYCGCNSGVYAIDATTYTVATLDLSFPMSGIKEKCRNFELNETDGKLYGLYINGNYTHVVQIDLSTTSIDQVHQFSYLDGEEITYDAVNQKVYIANTRLPLLYVYNPSNFNLITSVSYYIQTILFNLHMDYDYYRNKIYLNYNDVAGEHQTTVIDCDDYTYQSQALNSPKSSQTWNPINEQQYFYNVAVNDDNRHELYCGVADCLDDDHLGDIYLGNLLNKNYLIRGNNDNTLPVFNDSRNRIYWPNGHFCNVSVIEAYTDDNNLRPGWTWLSFPRLERTDNNPVQTGPVLERVNYFPCNMELIDQYYSTMEYLVGSGWSGDLDFVNSTKGYKLYLNIESPEPFIEMHGAKLDPGTQLTLYPNQDNWIAYFLEEGQYPWEAFPSDLYNNHLTHIQAQFWAMAKVDDKWLMADVVAPIQYADMVNVRIAGNLPITFTWSPTDVGREEAELLETEYYTYEEQSDYLPLYVETDSTSDVQEIAVLAEGEVRGAAVRGDNDTLVEVNAYLEGVPAGTPLEFETWSGLKSAKPSKTTYLVRDMVNKTYQDRKIFKGESADFHVVSLKKGQSAEKPEIINALRCSPNPFSTSTKLSFSISAEFEVKLSVYDLSGNEVCSLMQGTYPAGFYEVTWEGNATAGHKLPEGVYFYKLYTGNGQMESGKIVLIK